MGGGASSAPAGAKEAEEAKAAEVGAASLGAEGGDSLEMYFQELKKFTDQEMKDLEEMDKLLKKDDSLKEVQQKQIEIKGNRGSFKVTAGRLLNECFSAWDTTGDGFLGPDESAKAFAFVIDEKAEYLGTMAKQEQSRMLADTLGLSAAMFDKFDCDDEAAVKAKLEEDKKAEAKRTGEEIDKAMVAAIEDYKKNKDIRNKVAFAVLDRSSDGRINKKEFMQAFDTTTPVYDQFLTALGLFNVGTIVAEAQEKAEKDAPAAEAEPAKEGDAKAEPAKDADAKAEPAKDDKADADAKAEPAKDDKAEPAADAKAEPAKDEKADAAPAEAAPAEAATEKAADAPAADAPKDAPAADAAEAPKEEEKK